MISPWHQHFHASRNYLIRLFIFFLILRKPFVSKKNIIFRYYETSLVTKCQLFCIIKNIVMIFFYEKGNTNSLEYVIWRLLIKHYCIFCDIYRLIFQIAPWTIAFSLNFCPFFHFQKHSLCLLKEKVIWDLPRTIEELSWWIQSPSW